MDDEEYGLRATILELHHDDLQFAASFVGTDVLPGRLTSMRRRLFVGRGVEHVEHRGSADAVLARRLREPELHRPHSVRQKPGVQPPHLGADDEVRAVALHNDRKQLSVWLRPVNEAAIVERHQQNGELFDACFGKDNYCALVDTVLGRSRHERRRAGSE
jgi:hypothetical protein